MITYPVDVVNTRWAVYRISTSEIVGRNQLWPVADGGAIPGLDPDYVYLLQSADTPPNYDARLYQLVSTENVNPPENTLHVTHSAVKRPNPDRVVAAQNEEGAHFVEHFPVERVALETCIAVGCLIAVTDGSTLPPRFRTFLTNYKTKVQTKVLPNYDRLIEIIGQIEAGDDPDLDSGWTTP